MITTNPDAPPDEAAEMGLAPEDVGTIRNWAGIASCPADLNLEPAVEAGPASSGPAGAIRFPAIGQWFAGFELIAILGARHIRPCLSGSTGRTG